MFAGMIGLNLPTPVTPLTSLSGFGLEEYGVSLDMKRDDLIHPFISGNKWRKLKYLLKDARSQQKRVLVTFGGAWSNHLLATACAGALFGFGTIGFVRGDEKVSNPLLAMCRMYGMELRFVDRGRYRDKRMLFDELAATEARPTGPVSGNVSGSDRMTAEDLYFVDEGGYAAGALAGCAEIVQELTTEYDHIFCACGTGTTLAGLSLGLQQAGCSTQLHGVPVLAGGEFIAENIRELYTDAVFQLHTDYHFGGYAKTKPELLQFIRTFCSQTGILIEPVYTGKLCYAVLDLIRMGNFERGCKILILHTGGMTGIMGMHELFCN